MIAVLAAALKVAVIYASDTFAMQMRVAGDCGSGELPETHGKIKSNYLVISDRGHDGGKNGTFFFFFPGSVNLISERPLLPYMLFHRCSVFVFFSLSDIPYIFAFHGDVNSNFLENKLEAEFLYFPRSPSHDLSLAFCILNKAHRTHINKI